VRFRSAFLSGSFAVLAIGVAAGWFTGIDQWAVDHLMPGATFTNEEAGLAEALIPLYGTHWDNAWSIVTNIVTVPASFLVALALCAWRSRALAIVVVVGTAVEALCKELLSRPALYDGAHQITGFDNSFPSGHSLRVVLVATLVAQPFGAAWAVASIALLLLGGWHTPSDIAGGIVLGLLGLLGARALRGRRLLGRRVRA
jgi:membrane-associated phospholipid phosphatase